MNRIQLDNVHSTIFTPQEYQVELIDSCLKGNTVTVLASRSTRTFLVTMVTRELSYQTRKKEQGGMNKRTLIVGNSGPKLVSAGEAIQQNTNLAVATYTSLEQVKDWTDKWEKVFFDSQVIVMTSEVLETGFETNYLRFENDLNLLVITDAHLMLSSRVLNKILSNISKSCRIVALTTPVLKQSLSPSLLDSLLNYLSRKTGCKINTSSEIVTILRYINKPRERLIICTSPFVCVRPDLETEVRQLIAQAMNFLDDHRYDPVEVYGQEYAEFCVGVPDPIREPKQILKDFLTVLDNLGLWCADRAALYSLVEIEKMKKKTAYDRHYLLLCVIFSVMARVRAVIEAAFDNHSELNQILNFSTPKVLRLIDILRQIRPLNFVDPRKRRDKVESPVEGTNAKQKDESSLEECNACGCPIYSLSKGKLNAIVNEDIPKDSSSTQGKENGCENLKDEREFNSSERFPENNEKESSILVQEENKDDRPNLPNGTIEGCDLPETCLPIVPLSSSCDYVSSSHTVVHSNGQVSGIDSEESDYKDSKPVDSHSIPNSDSGTSELLNHEGKNVSMELSDTTSESSALIGSTTSPLPPQEVPFPEEENTIKATQLQQPNADKHCTCYCHNSSEGSSSRPLSVISQINGCDSLSDDKEKVDASSNPDKPEVESSELKETVTDVQNDPDTTIADSNLKDPSNKEEFEEIGNSYKNSAEGEQETEQTEINITIKEEDNKEIQENSIEILQNGDAKNIDTDLKEFSAENSIEALETKDGKIFSVLENSEVSDTKEPENFNESDTKKPENSNKSDTKKLENSNESEKIQERENSKESEENSQVGAAIVTDDNETLKDSLTSNSSHAAESTQNGRMNDDSEEEIEIKKESGTNASTIQAGNSPTEIHDSLESNCIEHMNNDDKEEDEENPSLTKDPTIQTSSSSELCDSTESNSNKQGDDEDEKETIEKETADSKEEKKVPTSEAVAMADTLAQLLPNTGRMRRRREEVREKVKVYNPDDPDSVCGLIFVQHRTTAKIIYRLLKELSDIGGDFSWIFPQYTVELCKKASDDPRAAEVEHRKQEEVLRRFRHHECNLLVSTAVLEEGIDIPNCNLVLRFDPSLSYTSYVFSRGRAKGTGESFYFHLVVKDEEEKILDDMASYAAYEQVLLNECGNADKGTDAEVTPDEANAADEPYTTSAGVSVYMASAISLLNKYCAKLPSDTFTRLTAMWSVESKEDSSHGVEYRCTIMLPINSPLKGFTHGCWMPKAALAKMSAALKCCERLHQIGELNDNLMPVGKESMQLDAHLCGPLPDDNVEEGMPRPGSTKRRQYYYKKVAECFVGNEPSPSIDLWVYKLEMVLNCPIPDEQNTRGRKIYRPELSARSFALVTTKPIPKVSGFPVFTRSGEVMVKIKEVKDQIRVSEEDLKDLETFHMFTFTHVLRLEKYPIKFHPTNAKSSFFIAPVMQENGTEKIDWDFVSLIRSKKDHKPSEPSLEERKNFKFKQSLYQDAVVMPWYRNQDQPQYFYVAEICGHLHPQSDFPDAGFESFEKYYLTKYGIQICNLGQPLLDVDHTSGRLNLLTPRHVNRKGVALPTTSEETKKAKRENLQQKQILVPELCTIHPFPASLWRKAVCLPTILYRLNGLLLADEFRVQVASEIGLGLTTLIVDFEWPNLDFGWTLADVLARSIEANKGGKNALTNKCGGVETKKDLMKRSSVKRNAQEEDDDEEEGKSKDKSGKGSGSESAKGSELEIGTWSNDMALTSALPEEDDNDDDFEIFDPNIELPANLTMLDSISGLDNDLEGELGADWGTGLTERKTRTIVRSEDRGSGMVRVGSPSNFETDMGWDTFNSGAPKTFGAYGNPYDDFYDCDDFEGFDSDPDYEEEEDKESKEEEDNEWEDQSKRRANEDKENQSEEEEEDSDWPDECLECSTEKKEEFETLIQRNKERLRDGSSYLSENEPLVIEKSFRKKVPSKTSDHSVQTEEKLLHATSAALKTNTILLEVSQDLVDKSEDHLDKATQTDDIAFAHNTEPEIMYNVDRENTLKEVKLASDNLPKVQEENDQTPMFSFDCQPDLEIHAGPPPSIVLQALTMSNANDGVNLERLETIGDSYLKYAITNYLYCTYTQKHEGKLSYLRSKQVSNLNLYRLGKRKGLGECMVATKFEPHDNWLPPGYFVPKELEEALIDSGVPAGHWNMADFPGLHDLGSEEIRRLVQERSEQIKQNKAEQLANELISVSNPQDLPIFIPYNLLTQHSIPDKSISDCVEALIGAYLTTCGPRGALLFMSWLGIKVLPSSAFEEPVKGPIITYHQLQPPPSPLSACPLPDAEEQLELLLSGYSEFEKKIGYTFRDRAYLLQAFTHASYYRNLLTDCYQRLEFLGDAVLDYLITRHLFEDKRQHSPGSLTDLRSALVNNTIFACLAVKFEFHKYFRHFSPGLDRVVRDFVRMQEENGHRINEEYYFMEEDECEAAEDIEVPKALGDVFESVAGAIFLDSRGSLDAVWKVYYSMMRNEIEQFSGVVPKSPIRELLETEPETAKFGKPERLVDGKVRVSVEIFGKGCFSGVGRNYRIAKSTAAKRALRHLKKLQMLAGSDSHQGIA